MGRIVYVIKKIEKDKENYWNSNLNEFSGIDKATKYEIKDEAIGRIHTKLPYGIYQVIEVIEKE